MVIREAAAQGWSICGIDPRGIGESATSQKGWLAAVSLLLNENFVVKQAADIARVIRAFQKKPVALYARGDNAALAAAYAIAQAPDLSWYILRDGFVSFHQFLDRPKSLQESYQLKSDDKERNSPYDHEIPFFYVPFDGFSQLDIPRMLAGSKAKGVIVSPIDGDWEVMPAATAEAVSPRPVISGAGVEERVRSFLRSQLVSAN
jgi:pimeloyl-ACP methyl ester carboxylesterase